MSKIGTVNLQNCKIGTGVVSAIKIGTSTYWSNVPKPMPPFDINEWFVSGSASGGSQSITLTNNLLVFNNHVAPTWNHSALLTSDTMRSAKHITFNYTVRTSVNPFTGNLIFIVEQFINNAWVEVERQRASANTVGQYQNLVNAGTYEDTVDVNLTSNRMRLKVDFSGFNGPQSSNLDTSITFNNIIFS